MNGADSERESATVTGEPATDVMSHLPFTSGCPPHDERMKSAAAAAIAEKMLFIAESFKVYGGVFPQKPDQKRTGDVRKRYCRVQNADAVAVLPEMGIKNSGDTISRPFPGISCCQSNIYV